MPAKNGVPADVPPVGTIVPVWTIRYGSWTPDAVNAMSGVWRALSFGTPGPVCHVGRAKTALIPPPPEFRNVPGAVSFQPTSGMYDKAEVSPAWLLGDQYLPLPSANVVPPTAVTSGTLAGVLMATPLIPI